MTVLLRWLRRDVVSTTDRYRHLTSQFAANPNVPPEVRENIRRSLGLDQPWPIRYVKWLLALAQGDMGYSFLSRSPVGELIWQRLPNTLAVVGVAYVIGVILGVPVGMLSAVKRYSAVDHTVTTFAFMGFSVPTFFTGTLLIIVFSVKLHWLPFIYQSRAVPGSENGYSGQNYTGWTDERFTQLADLAANSLERRTRREWYLEMQRIWTAALPAIPLYQRAQVDVADARLMELRPLATRQPITWNAARWSWAAGL